MGESAAPPSWPPAYILPGHSAAAGSQYLAVIIEALGNGIVETPATQSDQLKVEPLLLEVADVVNTTLDLDTTLRRVAELVRRVIDYEIFAILLVNEKAQDLRIRFQVGYAREVAERVKIKIGEGVTGLAAQRREAILVDDVSKHPEYISGSAQRALGAGDSADREEPGHRSAESRSARGRLLHRGAQAPVDA